MLGSVTEGGLMQIDPKHLMIIAEISDAGGFIEAADSLGTSQPAISRVVKMLEQRLGEPIFHRVRKPLQLTSAGAVLADQGRAILTPDADVSFTPLLPGRNVIACRVGHPLFSKSEITPEDYAAYPWVAPPPRSPLNRDLRNALAVAGVERVRIAAPGARLGTLINYLIHTDCLSVLPHTVVFAMRRRGTVSALPVKLDHPARTLGLLLPRSTPPPPTARNLAAH